MLKTTVSKFDNPWGDDKADKGKTKTPPEERKAAEKKIKGIDFITWTDSSSGNGSSNDNFNRGIKTFIWGALILALLGVLSTGFYVVAPDEEGVVVRFGKYNRTSQSGLNYKLPDPIERVTKVPITKINRDVLGVVQTQQDSGRKNNTEKGAMTFSEESQMLTGDENIIDMHFFVQWKIKDPYNYIFRMKDTQEDSTLRISAESAMREVIGTVNLHDALSEQRQPIEKRVTAILQKMLDEYCTGIEVVSLGILYSYVPAEVRDAYRDVQAAKADKEKLINESYSYRNDIIPKARGEAYSILEKAKGEKEAIIASAQGKAQKLSNIYSAYQSAPELTKKKFYIETMEAIMVDTDKIFIAKDVGQSTIPLLSLQETFMKNKKE